MIAGVICRPHHHPQKPLLSQLTSPAAQGSWDQFREVDPGGWDILPEWETGSNDIKVQWKAMGPTAQARGDPWNEGPATPMEGKRWAQGTRGVWNPAQSPGLNGLKVPLKHPWFSLLNFSKLCMFCGVGVCAPVGAKGWHWASCSIALHYTFWGKSSNWARTLLLDETSQPANPWVPSLCLPRAGIVGQCCRAWHLWWWFRLRSPGLCSKRCTEPSPCSQVFSW